MNHLKMYLWPVILVGASLPAWANDHFPSPATNMYDAPNGTQIEIADDQQQVFKAVHNGDIHPFSALYDKVDQQLHGRVIKVELNQKNHQWVYELRLVYQDTVYNVSYNAKSLNMTAIRGRNVTAVLK
ncbi:MAG: PepSY domain-containing protein [Vibrio sp.]